MLIGILDVRDRNVCSGPWSRYGCYAEELLGHAGMPFEAIRADELAARIDGLSLLLIPSDAALSESLKEALEAYVTRGGALIALGGPSGLQTLFGCTTSGRVEEAWVLPAASPHGASPHPITAGISKHLHAFGGSRIAVSDPKAQVLAYWVDGSEWSDHDRDWVPATRQPALLACRRGRGVAVLIAADLVHSVLRIQQGIAVHVDGRPAPDGSAPVDDGILKVDDGIVLDYSRDRIEVGGELVFGLPIADEWRELLVRTVLWSAGQVGAVVPMLWYWPNALRAVAQISHDTDGNVPEYGRVLFDAMQRSGIPSTWCTQYPGGYSTAFYKELTEAGHEIALHYDAHSGTRRTGWGEGDFQVQHDWLSDIAQVQLVSNKNHYLRWEGLVDFFLWMERKGLKSDQTKGPTKRGNNGFPFGGTHVWFPMEEHRLRPIDVLEVNHQTWELGMRCSYDLGPWVIDQAKRQGGVAHFLYHPGLVIRPQVAETLHRVVAYGKEQALAWWTNARIQSWERQRRNVRFTREKGADGTVWTAHADTEIHCATLLTFAPDAQVRPARKSAQSFTYAGFAASVQVVDLRPGEPRTF